MFCVSEATVSNVCKRLFIYLIFFFSKPCELGRGESNYSGSHVYRVCGDKTIIFCHIHSWFENANKYKAEIFFCSMSDPWTIGDSSNEVAKGVEGSQLLSASCWCFFPCSLRQVVHNTWGGFKHIESNVLYIYTYIYTSNMFTSTIWSSDWQFSAVTLVLLLAR